MATALTQRQLDQAVDTYLMPREADHVCELCNEPFEIGETGVSDDDGGMCFPCLLEMEDRYNADVSLALERNTGSLSKELRLKIRRIKRLVADAIMG